MATLGFPSNPTIGQKYTTASGQTYIWNGSVWSIQTVAPQNVSTVTTYNFVVTGNTATVGGAVVITSATIYQYITQANTSSQGVMTLLAGTDTAIATVGFTATIWNTSTLESVTLRGNTTDQTIRLTNTSTSTSTTTGALTVAGGVGIRGNLNVGGTTNLTGNLTLTGTENIANNTNATSTTTGALVVQGGVGIGRDLWVGGNLYLQAHQVLTTASFFNVVQSGPDILITATSNTLYFSDISTLESVTTRGAISDQVITLTNATDSTSTTTGALVVKNGIGVGGNITIGGAIQLLAADITSAQTVINTTATTVIDVYPVTYYRTAKYVVQIESGAGYGALFEAVEILLLVDNLQNVYSTEYSRVGPTVLGEFSADVELDNNVRLYFTPYISGTTMTIKLIRTTVAF